MEDSGKMKNLALDGDRFSRDLLQSFMGVGGRAGGCESEKAAEVGGEVELNLGLSLGGRFGVDKSPNKLVRSSSISTCLPTVLEDEAAKAAPSSPAAYSSLVRTSSLPVETEEEWRKRKELQSMRRMEAKRRRSEKQRNSSRGDKDDDGGGCSNADEQYLAAAKSYYGGGIEVGAIPKGRKNYPSTRGSLESQRGSCSSMSEFESKFILGTDELSPGSIQSLQDGRVQEAGSSTTTKTRDHATKMVGNETETSSNKLALASLQARELGTTTVEDMPCVFTKGDGPNGKRIDGILYKYGKGEDVRIMCVCHGTFLSPSEFVTHAGGGDVAHPLKHIVINRNSSPFR